MEIQTLSGFAPPEIWTHAGPTRLGAPPLTKAQGATQDGLYNYGPDSGVMEGPLRACHIQPTLRLVHTGSASPETRPGAGRGETMLEAFEAFPMRIHWPMVVWKSPP